MNAREHDTPTPDDGAVAEATLREALAPLAPDRGAFVAGVRRRVTEAEADAAARARRLESAAASPWLRRAASLLPPTLVGPEVAAVAAKTAAKSAGWKSLPALLTAPVVALAAIAGLVALAWRSAANLRGEREYSTRATLDDLKVWWTQRWAVVVAGLLVIGGVLWLSPAVGALVTVLASMAVCSVVLRRLGAEGLATRQAIGGALAGLLSLLAGVLFALGMLFESHLTARLSMWWPWMLLIAGGALCRLLAAPGREARRRLLPTTIAFALGLWVMLPIERLTPVDARAWVRDFVASPREPFRWAEWSTTARLLRLADEPVELDAGALRSQVAPPLDVPIAIAVLRAGVELVEMPEAPLYDDSPTFLGIADRQLASLWAHARLLEPPTALMQAFHVVRAWPDDPDDFTFDPLESIALVVDTVDRLGHPEIADERRADAHAALLASWRGPEAGPGRPACFGRRLIHPDFAAAFAMDETAAAVELIARFGVPAPLDVEQLRAWLRAATRRAGPERWWSVEGPDALGAAALAALDRAVPPAPTPWWRWLLDEQVTLAVLALVLLCAAVTTRAPWGHDVAPRLRRGARRPLSADER